MSDNEFSENMVVCAVGILSPGNISDSCESCPHNKFSLPGVLIDGVTKDAVMLLSEKVEIVPEGTKAKVAELEASNKELLDVLEDFVIDVEGFFGFSEGDDMQPEDDVAYFIGEYCRAKHLIKKEKGIKE